MHAYEKLGVFYLGRPYDPAADRTCAEPLLLSSDDLLTHALVVGMTGSGKTGLCCALIEEAAMDAIPAILIDPKGDLGNLLLTFPQLEARDFESWIDPDEARKRGLTSAQFAAQQAEMWRQGLAGWDQAPERIERLRATADFAIYTPGSQSGLPVSILHSFAAPPAALIEDAELLRERVNTTVGSLLGLLGVDSDPTRGREAVFLANILQRAWLDGRDLDLGALIHEIQTPSIKRIGVMDVEAFYPAQDRFELATALNGIIASPGFGAWLEGEPLDIRRILYTASGRPRIAIFSIAHLGDAERMFFVTLLLNQVLGWMRTQSGTTSLRALVYMDEIFGYFPPIANPPSKLPLLTLLKQGRAFGVGTVLATQNPVDLDYKGLANIGTWFLGRLQTERDKQRVIEGLEGAAAAQGSGFNRTAMEQTLASLGQRRFLLHSVHADDDVLFETRWAMSYLRGPMTRQQIRAANALHGSAPGESSKPSPDAPSPLAAVQSAAPLAAIAARPPAVPASSHLQSGEAENSPNRPALPPAIPQHFLPLPPAAPHGPARYTPMLLAAATVRYADAKAKVSHAEEVRLLVPIHDSAIPVDWSEAHDISAELDPATLERQPEADAAFVPLPPAAAVARNYPAWQKEFVSTLQVHRKLLLFKSALAGVYSAPGETEGDFRVRLQQLAREKRAATVTALRARYAPKLAQLRERLRRAEQSVEKEAEQARSAKLSTALSFGSTLLSAFLGRKTVTATNVGKAATAMRGVGRSMEQSKDVDRATETVATLERQLADLEAEFEAEAGAVESGSTFATEPLETIEVRPKKTHIAVQLFALAWVPQGTLPANPRAQ